MANMYSRRMMKNMLTRRTGGQRVVGENVALLKALDTVPKIASVESDNYYKEPVTIEYYIPKESRFAYQIKYLYIRLHDPEPIAENPKLIMGYFKDRNEPIDVMKVMDEFPQFLVTLLDLLSPYMALMESLARNIQDGHSGDTLAYRRALHITEVLRKFEPSLISLEFMGDYTTYNINWFIRKLNAEKIDFSLEDPTVEYLINRYRKFAAEAGEEIPERFNILSDIYLDQAFPMSDDDFADLEIPD